jgi:hypothetical protein
MIGSLLGLLLAGMVVLVPAFRRSLDDESERLLGKGAGTQVLVTSVTKQGPWP